MRFALQGRRSGSCAFCTAMVLAALSACSDDVAIICDAQIRCVVDGYSHAAVDRCHERIDGAADGDLEACSDCIRDVPDEGLNKKDPTEVRIWCHEIRDRCVHPALGPRICDGNVW